MVSVGVGEVGWVRDVWLAGWIGSGARVAVLEGVGENEAVRVGVGVELAPEAKDPAPVEALKLPFPKPSLT